MRLAKRLRSRGGGAVRPICVRRIGSNPIAPVGAEAFEATEESLSPGMRLSTRTREWPGHSKQWRLRPSNEAADYASHSCYRDHLGDAARIAPAGFGCR